MSSVNNNGNGGNNNVSPETLAEVQLRKRAQKTSDEAINKANKAREENAESILELLGMTPTAAKHAMTGTTPKNNKFSIAGSATHLPPPSVPKYKAINEKTQQLYSSMHRDIHEAIGNTKVGLEKIDFKSLLSPQVKAVKTEAEASAQAQKIGKQTAETVKEIGNQLSTLSSSNLTMAFLMLRVNGQSDGLDIQNQMGDLASSLRKVSLNEQIAQSKAAEKALQKAMKKQEALKPLAPLLAVITAILSVLFAVATMGTGTGLAVTAAAAVIGFITGGSVGGKKKGNGFDITSAFEGLSIGASIVPGAQMLKAIMVGIMNSVEKVLVRIGAVKALSKEIEVVSQQAGKNVVNGQNSRASLERGSKDLGSLDDLSGTAGQDVTNEIAKQTETVVTTHVNEFILKLSQKLQGVTDKSLSKVGFTSKAKDPNASLLQQWIEKGNIQFGANMDAKKVTTVVEGVAMVLPSVAEVAKAAGNYAVTEKNLEAQEHLNESKLWGVLAKTEQGSWQGTQDVLSMLQDYHTQGVTQATTILQSHHQAAMRAIQFNKA